MKSMNEDHGREERALEALLAASLRPAGKEPVDALTAESLSAFARNLTDEDRAALERRTKPLDPGGLPDRAATGGQLGGTERRREALRDAQPGRRPRERRGAGSGGPSRRRASRTGGWRWNGGTVMKSLALSLILTASLVAGVFLGTGLGIGDPEPAVSLTTAEALARVEEDVRRLDERLEELARLETEVEPLAVLAARSEKAGPPSASAGEEKGEPRSSGAGADGPEAGGETLREAGDILAARGEEGLRAWVREVIATEREERRVAARRRALERRREQEELHEGPYGEHNYRVNSLARRLDLSERQKQSLYLNLLHYNEAIRAMRKLEEELDENDAGRARYREERKRLREEFRQVFVATLTPEQAEVFSDLPEHQQRPDGSVGNLLKLKVGGATLITETPGDPSDLVPRRIHISRNPPEDFEDLETVPPEPAEEESEEEEEK